MPTTRKAYRARFSAVFDFLFGRPLASHADQLERTGVATGIPIFGLDALSSAAYGPEAALTLLIPLGAAGVAYLVPISASIVVLLSIVFFSYRQTIAAYPGGGGSYTVASENLGTGPGLLAAAALMIDYILDVAVGIAAGVGALVSAVPRLQPHTLSLCLGILALLTLVNLRGLRETGAVFMLPTYMFVGTLLAVLAIGLYQALLHGGHPLPVIRPPAAPAARDAVTLWLLLKAFASGCTAMTGVEAVSNGVRAFREPRTQSARTTLTIIIALLIVLLLGIAYLVRAYSISATAPGAPGYQSVLSMLAAAVIGRGTFYYVTLGSVVVVLALSANTAFADFPRLCHAIAENRYLPFPMSLRGRRLVYTEGIVVLVVVAGFLLIVFRGITDRLIPLFAIGAFLAFTLSQAGMVVHWKRNPGPGARLSMLINGLGATATGITVCIVAAAKFTDGAWITAILIPTLILLMVSIRRHYNRILREIASDKPLSLAGISPALVVVPLDQWSRIAAKALRFAYTLSPDVQAVHVDVGQKCELPKQWSTLVEAPLRHQRAEPPKLTVLKSPYRFVLNPILQYVLDLERRHPDRQIAVVVPELVERRWYYYLLHNQRATALKVLLYLSGNPHIVVINVPWYLDE